MCHYGKCGKIFDVHSLPNKKSNSELSHEKMQAVM